MNQKTKTTYLAKLALLIVAFLWGTSLTFVKQASVAFSPNLILGIRFTLASVLLSIIFWKKLKAASKKDFIHGGIIGIFLFLGYSSQTIGVSFADPGRSGFLSASYCVIVPFLYWFVKKIRPDKFNILAALLCVGGIFFIAFSGGQDSFFTTNPKAFLGDGLALLSGFLFASHIVSVSILGKDRDTFTLTISQFIVASILSWITSFLFESPLQTSFQLQATIEVIYLAVFCTAIALLLQNIGQQHCSPSSASIILGFESVFGILFPVFLGIEHVTIYSIIGFVLIFAAILTSETKLSFLFKKEGSAKHSSIN